MKKIIVFCVAFLATMSLWASHASVKNAYGVEIWYDFDSSTNTASVMYSGDCTGEVVIPSTVTYEGEEYSVTEIGISAFEDCSSLTSITIPEGVTSIGKSAFEGCSSLTSITIPKSVTSIGGEAFEGCSSLTSITIPESVTEIATAFEGCSSLTSIDVAPNNENYTSIDGVLFSKDKTILIKYPEDKKDITSYTIPNGVTEIGYGAFEDCSSLTSITIPESVTSIGDAAFSWCSALTSVTIPENVTSIGEDAFYGTALYNTESNWDNNVLYIDNCFIKAKDNISGEYIIKNGTRLIGDGAFRYCLSLTSITIPEGVTSIGKSAFYNCYSLTSITIPESVISIGDYTFWYCSSLTSIDVALNNENYTSIDGVLFSKDKAILIQYPEGKDATSYTIPEGVTSIGDYAFDDCSSLTSVTIPNSVTSIGEGAFWYCI